MRQEGILSRQFSAYVGKNLALHCEVAAGYSEVENVNFKKF